MDGVLYTVVGNRRTVAAIDGGTGETLWTYREPHTTRWERSTRRGHGKGVAYAEVDGQGVIFVATPAFFLHALDAEPAATSKAGARRFRFRGSPSRRGGSPGGHSGRVGAVGGLRGTGRELRPRFRRAGRARTHHQLCAPIVVNGVVVIGNSAESGNEQLRMENIPGDILAYDARDGEQRWKFHVIPRPGEFGHDTWENDAWQWDRRRLLLGADIGRSRARDGLHRHEPPHDGLLRRVPAGRRALRQQHRRAGRRDRRAGVHFQMVRHDIWDYDTSVAPLLIDVTVDGEEIPALVANGKHGLTFVFDRATGEPVWPIELRPVPASRVPGEQVSPVQPFPTRPEPVGFLGLPEEELIDYTPELRREALEILEDFDWGQEPYTPYIHEGNELGKIATINCPSGSPNTGAGAIGRSGDGTRLHLREPELPLPPARVGVGDGCARKSGVHRHEHEPGLHHGRDDHRVGARPGEHGLQGSPRGFPSGGLPTAGSSRST